MPPKGKKGAKTAAKGGKGKATSTPISHPMSDVEDIVHSSRPTTPWLNKSFSEFCVQLSSQSWAVVDEDSADTGTSLQGC